MKFTVLNNGAVCGTLTFVGNLYHFEGDSACSVFIADSVRAGLTIKSDVCVDGVFSIIQKPISTSDKLFPYALIGHLRDSGYVLYEFLEEVEATFQNILSALSKDEAFCAQLRERWSVMSTLEKTYLLDLLEKDSVA